MVKNDILHRLDELKNDLIDNLEDFDELFEKSKIIIGKNVENKKCDFCQI